MTPLEAVAARVASLPLPARVGIDGVTAAGKSTFADALAALLDPPVARVTIDEFHRPGQPDCYLEEVGPVSLADLVVDTTDPSRHVLVVDTEGRRICRRS